MTNAPDYGRTDCFSLDREQAVGGGSVYSFESQELPHSKLVLSHRIKTTDFPIDFQELLSYQRKASIKMCATFVPALWEGLITGEATFLLSNFGRTQNLLHFLTVP